MHSICVYECLQNMINKKLFKDFNYNNTVVTRLIMLCGLGEVISVQVSDPVH